jgi:hypothetical protein
VGAARRVGLGDHDDQVGQLAVGDERLLSIEDVRVAVAHRGGTHPGQVGAGARLAHRDGRDQVAGAEAGQPALALLVGGQLGEVRCDHVVVQAEAEAGAAGTDDLLDQYRVEPEVALPAAAVLLRHVKAEQAGGAGLAPHRAVDQAGLLPRRVVRHRLAGEEGAAQFPELLMDRFVQVLFHKARVCQASSSATTRRSARKPW